jgi:hypothetical protein
MEPKIYSPSSYSPSACACPPLSAFKDTMVLGYCCLLVAKDKLFLGVKATMFRVLAKADKRNITAPVEVIFMLL